MDTDPAGLAIAFHSALVAAKTEIDKEESDKIELVIVTGDLVESGVPSEYEIAYQFMAEFANQLQLSKEKFVFLPGNHDISWPSCQRVRAELADQLFPADELEERINVAKLANFHKFIEKFYGSPVTSTSYAGLQHSTPLKQGGWLRNFPDLKVSVAALNTSERENDMEKGGFLSQIQAESLMKAWLESESMSFLKVIALHHNPIATTTKNVSFTIEWLREKEASYSGCTPMSADAFRRYVDDLIGFTGKEHLVAITRDVCPHLIIHGHHHDQGVPIVWPWAKDGGAPVLSVGSFGLSDEHLTGRAPLSCQLIRIIVPPKAKEPRLSTKPLVYDPRHRLTGSVSLGAFRTEIRSSAEYDQAFPLPAGWEADARDDKKQPINNNAESARDPAPKAPALYAQPPYIGSHSFVGRNSQIETLNEWASPDDSHSILLYEAIGGIGKSMLTWEWMTKHAQNVRSDWAGRFWYSFYERGATMVDFCRRALSYMTGTPKHLFKEKNTAELTAELVDHLRNQTWLLVLDGLERVLVSYHRIDASHIRDDKAGLSDHISDRDPCAAINPEDEDLLRALSSANPSKLLLTSRLAPRPLLNRSGQPIPGVLRERLPGLRSADAELLIRGCGVTGNSKHIQAYLRAHCDCHPLVIGVLAGLITDYIPDRGNFDAWVSDPQGGGALNMADLDLVQKRNHILSVAFKALPESGRQLLATLALLSDSVDYPTLSALNPSLPPLPEFVEQPKALPSKKPKKKTDDEWKELQQNFENEKLRRDEFDLALARRDQEIRMAAPLLAESLKDLERRGLLQYDHASKRYDLHPVVRGVAVGGLRHDEKSHYGQRVVDHFSQQAHNPYDQAESISDFDNARIIVKALFQMGKKEDARVFINKNNFVSVLNSRFEAHNEILSIVRPFFSEDWTEAPLVYHDRGGMALASIAAISLRRIRAFDRAFSVSEAAITESVKVRNWSPLCAQLLSLSSTAGEQNRLALEDRLMLLALRACRLKFFKKGSETKVQLARFRQLSKLGRFKEADDIWCELIEREHSSSSMAVASHHRALHLFFQGLLTDEILQEAESKNALESALGLRNLVGLRGFWYLECENWALAKTSLQQAVSLAHKVGKVDRRSEIRLALAKAKMGELVDPEITADQFSINIESHCYRAIAELYYAIGHRENSLRFAEMAFDWACADGKPYAHFYEANKASNLLRLLGRECVEDRLCNPEGSVNTAVEEVATNAIEALELIESESRIAIF